MKLLNEIERVRDPARPRKSLAHLLLLPVALGVAGVCCYLLVFASVHFATLFREGVRGFSSYTEPTKTLIVLPMLLAAFPLGLISANMLAWSIPPVRRYFDREARGRPSGDFKSSMNGLLLFAKYVTTTLIIVGFGAALWGR